MNKRIESWVLQPLLDVQHTDFACVFSADGLLMGKTENVDRDDADRFAAGATGLQALSRSVGTAANEAAAWLQTVVETTDGYVLLVAAGEGAYLGVQTGRDVDLERLTFKVQQLVQSINSYLSAAPREDVGLPS
ncbi:roadblock/LC7 domain-containing protein [Streptomyces sp. NPDC047002]|uniref:roadblock/LC7 domain-containing protein n=1 Tax=Streptomyces sp. NPDC047002 TaxID=3155475 RepID=UPI0034511FCC